MYILINSIIFLLISVFLFFRVYKNNKVQVIDVFLMFFSLFYPLGLIRFINGFPSVIGFRLGDHENTLIFSSFIVLLGLLLFIAGSISCSFLLKDRRRNGFDYKGVSTSYSNYITVILLSTLALVLFKSITFLLGFGSVVNYFSHIDSVRQNLTGQMASFLLIYFLVFFASYKALIIRKFDKVILLSYAVGMLSFSVYGFRGPVISIMVLIVWVAQFNTKIRIGVNLKSILISIIILSFFLGYQMLRNSGFSSDPLYAKFLARFGGYEALVVMVDKIVNGNHFSFMTIFDNFISFIELPIPRSLYTDKLVPVSLTLAKDIFFDVGYRSFSTGGISPTIMGSLIWNLSLPGCFLMYFIGMATQFVEFKINYSNSDIGRVFYLGIGLYLILSVEAPENSFGFLWFVILSVAMIFILRELYFLFKSIKL